MEHERGTDGTDADPDGTRVWDVEAGLEQPEQPVEGVGMSASAVLERPADPAEPGLEFGSLPCQGRVGLGTFFLGGGLVEELEVLGSDPPGRGHAPRGCACARRNVNAAAPNSRSSVVRAASSRTRSGLSGGSGRSEVDMNHLCSQEVVEAGLATLAARAAGVPTDELGVRR